MFACRIVDKAIMSEFVEGIISDQPTWDGLNDNKDVCLNANEFILLATMHCRSTGENGAFRILVWSQLINLPGITFTSQLHEQPMTLREFIPLSTVSSSTPPNDERINIPQCRQI